MKYFTIVLSMSQYNVQMYLSDNLTQYNSQHQPKPFNASLA